MEYLIKACAVLSLFYVVYVMFLRKETFFKAIRWYFIFGILATTFLPFINFISYVDIPYQPLENIIPTTNIANTQDAQIHHNNINWKQVLWVVYFLGIMVFCIKFIIELLSLRNHIQKGRLTKNGHYNFVEVTENDEPFSFFNWIVYNPKMYSDTEMNQILIHEKTHVDGGHSYDLILSKITTIIFWFFPLTRWYTKAIKQNLEYISDQQSCAKVHCRKSYQTLLLKQTLPNYKYQLVIT